MEEKNRASEKDIENKDGEVREVHHHGRCDVGSAWAKGTVKNPECVDIPNTDAIDE